MPSARPTIHLVDATYELFRAWFAVPPAKAPDGQEVGATRGVLATLAYLVQQEGATQCPSPHRRYLLPYARMAFPSAGNPLSSKCTKDHQ